MFMGDTYIIYSCTKGMNTAIEPNLGCPGCELENLRALRENKDSEG